MRTPLSPVGMTLQKNQPEHANAAYLCRPLYVIYLEAAAFHEVYPDLISSVTIDGDPDDAKKVNYRSLLSPPHYRSDTRIFYTALTSISTTGGYRHDSPQPPGLRKLVELCRFSRSSKLRQEPMKTRTRKRMTSLQKSTWPRRRSASLEQLLEAEKPMQRNRIN